MDFLPDLAPWLADALWVAFLPVAAVVLWLAATQLLYLSTWPLTGLPSVPTDRKSRKAIIECIRKHGNTLPNAPVIYDLGSGFGHMAIDCARALPEAKVVGIEMLGLPLWVARMKQKILRLSNLVFVKGDFFRKPLKDANAVVFFGIGYKMPVLAEKLEHAVAPGTLVISNNFPLPGREPDLVTTVRDVFTTRHIYGYRF